jgi:4-hydroxy-tetrahydrodipicolinate synthase
MTAPGDMPLRGVIPPLALPLRPDGTPDLAGVARQVEHLLAAGVSGLWVNGTTGEFFALDAPARAAVLRAAVEAAAGRVPVIAQVGDTSTGLALRHAALAAEAGATHLSAVAPYYAPPSAQEVLAYYRALAAATPLPLLIYQVPQFTQVALSGSDVLALAREGSVVGLKDSLGDLGYFRSLTHHARAAGVPLACFVGGGNLLDLSLLAGAAGAMCAIANLVPRHCVRLYEAAQAGDWQGAAQRQAELLDLMGRLTLPHRPQWTTTLAVYKWLLRALELVEHDVVSAPIQPLDAADQQRLRETALPLIRRMEALAVPEVASP